MITVVPGPGHLDARDDDPVRGGEHHPDGAALGDGLLARHAKDGDNARRRCRPWPTAARTGITMTVMADRTPTIPTTTSSSTRVKPASADRTDDVRVLIGTFGITGCLARQRPEA